MVPGAQLSQVWLGLLEIGVEIGKARNQVCFSSVSLKLYSLFFLLLSEYLLSSL